MIGRRQRFRHRERIDIERMGEQSREFLLANGWIPQHLEAAYESLTRDLLEAVSETFDNAHGVAELRLHGDCHRGNVLWTDAGPHFVDLDDCLTGPAIQDLWMLLSGDRAAMGAQMRCLLEGYRAFMPFDVRELALVEPLRTLRMIHHSAWIAERWADPAFPAAFPWFGSASYWSQQTTQLREQLEAMGEAAIEV